VANERFEHGLAFGGGAERKDDLGATERSDGSGHGRAGVVQETDRRASAAPVMNKAGPAETLQIGGDSASGGPRCPSRRKFRSRPRVGRRGSRQLVERRALALLDDRE